MLNTNWSAEYTPEYTNTVRTATLKRADPGDDGKPVRLAALDVDGFMVKLTVIELRELATAAERLAEEMEPSW